MLVTFENIVLDENTSTSENGAWKFLYTKYDGNYNFF